MHNTRVTRVIVFLLICLLALFPFPQHLWHHLLVYSRNPDFIISCKPLLFHPCNELVYSHRTNTPTPLPFYLIIFRNSVLYSELLCLCGIRMLQINCSSTYIQVVTRTHTPSQFDRVKSHVRDPSSNSMLLLTSIIIVPSFIILRRLVHELSWERTDGRTDI